MVLYLTGIDGSGKTLLADALEEHFNTRHITTLRIWARYSPKLARGIVNIYKKRKLQSAGNYNTITPEEYTEWQKQKKSFPALSYSGLQLCYFFLLIIIFRYYLCLRKSESSMERQL